MKYDVTIKISMTQTLTLEKATLEQAKDAAVEYMDWDYGRFEYDIEYVEGVEHATNNTSLVDSDELH